MKEKFEGDSAYLRAKNPEIDKEKEKNPEGSGEQEVKMSYHS